MFNEYMYFSCLSVEFPEICIFAHRNNARKEHTCNRVALTTTVNGHVILQLMFMNMDLTKEHVTTFYPCICVMNNNLPVYNRLKCFLNFLFFMQ